VRPLLLACDFDGTITERDTLHVIVERFGTPGAWDRIEPRLRAGELTVEQAMEHQFAAVRARPEEVRELVLRDAPVRAGFHAFVRWADEGGHRLVVMSSGFASVIADVLSHSGLGHLEVHSHEARFSETGCRLEWSDRGPRCERCGRRCKRHVISGLREPGQPLVYIGDGISDRCASLMADLVFARDGLARWLDEQGAPFELFEDFVEVRRSLDARLPVLAA
jgi:2-hydroxy-3-keto-5-methylthiopentenyl-1-phosphate phosphatase